MLSNPVVFDYESCIQFADSLILREKSLFADRIFVSTEIFVALVGRVQLSVGNLSKRLRMVSRKQKNMSSEERSLPSPLGGSSQLDPAPLGRGSLPHLEDLPTNHCY